MFDILSFALRIKEPPWRKPEWLDHVIWASTRRSLVCQTTVHSVMNATGFTATFTRVYMMPPRSKRKPAVSTRVTRSKVQVPGAPGELVSFKAKKAVKNGSTVAPGPSTRPTRSNLVMEVVLPASKRPTPKTSSVLTPISPAPSATGDVPELPGSSPLKLSEPIRESTPQPIAQDKGKQRMMDSLPPSSPPPNTSPIPGFHWDRSDDPGFSTPTPSPARSRLPSIQASVRQLTPKPTTPASNSPSHHSTPPPADDHPDLAVVSQQSSPPSQQWEEAHKPPTSPVPYSDTPAADDPFGFVAAENRLRERRAQLERERQTENLSEQPHFPSSGGPESFDQSVYEEAFASIFYDPHSGTVPLSAVGSEKEATGANKSTTGSLYDTDGNGNGNGDENVGRGMKRKQTMEVVIPTKDKGKEKEKEKEVVKGEAVALEEVPPKPTRGKGKGKGKGKAQEHVLTTYELEAMLPHRIRHVRKRQPEAEHIALSDIDEEDQSSSPKRRKKAPATKGKAVQGVAAKAKKGAKAASAGSSKNVKATTRSTKHTRGSDVAGTNDETREQFEAERKRRLDAYKALDKYTLEEEEVIW
ncbi:hypothetical protein CTheo_3107 [Ceratobasidium theobromae]|uniref:Uncharacterized protein n=1 Tax=Ceratobasidium theobromae TaxID=1582974 RepID=A0A5N5QPH5_9AGAM|nr:hypothetical protein CTheo_3107 [Ceratobasidium theobromae]